MLVKATVRTERQHFERWWNFNDMKRVENNIKGWTKKKLPWLVVDWNVGLMIKTCNRDYLCEDELPKKLDVRKTLEASKASNVWSLTRCLTLLLRCERVQHEMLNSRISRKYPDMLTFQTHISVEKFLWIYLLRRQSEKNSKFVAAALAFAHTLHSFWTEKRWKLFSLLESLSWIQGFFWNR